MKRWPSQPTQLGEKCIDDFTVAVAGISQGYEHESFEKLIHYYSDLKRLVKVVAYVLRLKRKLCKVNDDASQDNSVSWSKSIDVDEMREAEYCILRYVQSQNFKQEMELLPIGDRRKVLQQARETNKVPRSSAVNCLDPFMECDLL